MSVLVQAVAAQAGLLRPLAQPQDPSQLPGQGDGTAATPTPGEPIVDQREVEDLGDAVDVVRETLVSMGEAVIGQIPFILLALTIFVGGLFIAQVAARWTARGLDRTSADQVVLRLSSRLVRFLVAVIFALVAFAVAGVNVGAALATLGLAGLALAFALQNILENFVAGLLLLIRKPFRAGDQIRTGDFEGTVEEIDFRVTRMVSYDGELTLIPNADVFRNPLTNLTRRATRRTIICVGIDYRDDHDRAREVLLEAVKGAEGVMELPEPVVQIVALGESSVDFEILYWSLPDIRSVRAVRDKVLAAAKTAVEEAGMTIPWPIRTLSFDNAVEVHEAAQGVRSNGGR